MLLRLAAIAPAFSGRRWIIDPIDGTAYFAHGIPLSLA
jgi:fructose-1,6-bisphosphatase/inositol monophosphatase family enzyme